MLSVGLQATPKSNRTIAEFPHIVIEEMVVTIKKAGIEDYAPVHLRQANLLPSYSVSEFISLESASLEFGISISELVKLVELNKLPSIKVDGEWYVLREAVKEYIDLRGK